MAVTYTIDGTPVTSVRIESVELVEMAETGNIGQGHLTIDDEAGIVSTVGHKDYQGIEDDCSSELLIAGQLGARVTRRGTHRAGGSRIIEATIKDLNELAARRVIHGTGAAGGRRPAETVGNRLRWILGSDFLSDLVVDSGFVDYPTTEMDKNDYRNSRPGDVIGDCSLAAGGRNWFIYPDEGSWTPSLWFRDSNTSTSYSSTLKLSTIASEIDWVTTFPANLDTALERDPEQVFSGVAVPYARGTKFETKASTATAFVERDGVAPTATIRTAAKASRLARRFLNDHDEETDTETVPVIVTSSKVNLIRAGMRIQGKFEWQGPEGYATDTWFRVLERRISHIISPGGIPEAPDEPLYLLNLRLSPQREAGPACPYETTDAGSFYPLGFDQAVDGWNWSAQPSDGVVYYLRPGYFYPTVPTPGHLGNWHFPAPLDPAAKGPGTINYAGTCCQNTLQFILVGPGTLTVQTEQWESTPFPMAGTWGESPNAYEHSAGTWTAGDSVVIELTGDCVNIVRIGDGPGVLCGSKWGWSQADWVPA